MRQSEISPIHPIRAFLRRGSCLWITFSPRSGAAGTRRSPCRRDVPALAAQAAQERSAGSRGYPTPVSAAAPLMRLIRAAPPGIPLWSTAPAFGGIPTLPAGGSGREFRIRQPISCRNRRWSALRPIPAPASDPPGSVRQRSSWTARDDNGNLATRENRGRETEHAPRAHGESGATPGAALTPGPRLLPFTNLRGRCVAAGTWKNSTRRWWPQVSSQPFLSARPPGRSPGHRRETDYDG